MHFVARRSTNHSRPAPDEAYERHRCSVGQRLLRWTEAQVCTLGSCDALPQAGVDMALPRPGRGRYALGGCARTSVGWGERVYGAEARRVGEGALGGIAAAVLELAPKEAYWKKDYAILASVLGLRFRRLCPRLCRCRFPRLLLPPQRRIFCMLASITRARPST